jgi:mRNA interferase HicA
LKPIDRAKRGGSTVKLTPNREIQTVASAHHLANHSWSIPPQIASDFQIARAAQHTFNTSVDFHTSVEWSIFMKASELKKLLAEKGCRFETHRGGSGHLTVIRGNKKSQLPMHGQKELGTGLVNKILKDLGLK